MIEFWNTRYKDEEYAYGVEPNLFFKNTLDTYNFEGKILLPAEGEGRNAVYAAKKGLEVFAFDTSIEGKRKAEKLANRENAIINYNVGTFTDLDLAAQQYDVCALIFAHFPPNISSAYHKRIADLIRPDGFLILEGFSKSNFELRQKNPKIGGPDKIEMLYSIETIKKDFSDFKIIDLTEKEIELKEGKFHNGIGSVIQFIGRKYSEKN